MVNLSLFRNLFIKSFFTIIIIFIKILLLFLLLLLLLLLLLSSCRPSQYQDCLSSGSYICNQYLSSISATICNGRGGGGGIELVSAEGTTQDGPLAMCLYAASLQPLSLVYRQLVKPNNAGLQMMRLGVDQFRTSRCGGMS